MAKVWNKEAAVALRARAEDYLVERKPEGFERSARAEAERNQLRM